MPRAPAPAPLRSRRPWHLRGALLVLLISWCVWYAREHFSDEVAELRPLVHGLLKNIFVPLLVWLGYLRWLRDRGPQASDKAGREHYLCGFPVHPKVRSFLIFVVVPGVGYLNWDVRLRAMARAGPAANATVQAIHSSKDFVKTLASFGLMPLVSMVTAAKEAQDTPRLLQVIGAGMLVGVASGLLSGLLIEAFAGPALRLFEGREPLLPEAVLLGRTCFASTGLSIVNNAVMGVLAGLHEHIIVGEVYVPGVIVAFAGTLLFRRSGGDLMVLMLGGMALDSVCCVLLAGKLWVAVTNLRADARRKEDGQAGSPPLAAALAPSRAVLGEMLGASGTYGIRMLAVRLKGFLSMMCASRLGNVEGSVYSLQQTLAAYLAGPAGLSGYATANLGPMLLEMNAIDGFVDCVRGTVFFLFLGSGCWFLFAAKGGPARVLEFTGALDSAAASDEEYLSVLTPLNHWIWAVATITNELAAPLDGFLMTLGSYRTIGLLYSGNLFFVLLPALAATQIDQLVPTGLLPGWNAFTGIALVQLLWGAFRLLGGTVALSRMEVPRLRRLQEEKAAACTPEVLIGYLKARADVPPEQVEAEKAEVNSKMQGIPREVFKYRAGGPLDRYAKEHSTSSESMVKLLFKLADHEDVKGPRQHFWSVWGQWM